MVDFRVKLLNFETLASEDSTLHYLKKVEEKKINTLRPKNIKLQSRI